MLVLSWPNFDHAFQAPMLVFGVVTKLYSALLFGSCPAAINCLHGKRFASWIDGISCGFSAEAVTGIAADWATSLKWKTSGTCYCKRFAVDVAVGTRM
ncbi:hypothetical protein ACOSQ2_032128 [Xanthoceras sorbifolium]